MTTQPTTFNDLPREIQLLIFGKAFYTKEANLKYHIDRFKQFDNDTYIIDDGDDDDDPGTIVKTKTMFSYFLFKHLQDHFIRIRSKVYDACEYEWEMTYEYEQSWKRYHEWCDMYNMNEEDNGLLVFKENPYLTLFRR